MQSLLAVSRAIDAVTGFIGHHIRWLILAAVLVSAVNAIVRKLFDISSNAWLELQWYLFGAVFMLAAAYVLQRNGHVRIDVLSNRLTERGRQWIDLFCHILMLLPLVLVMIWLSVPFVIDSYRSGEISTNAGGLIIWPSKLFVLLGFVLLLLQAISEIIKRIGFLTGALQEAEPEAIHGLTPEELGVKGRQPE
ncbi:TRAP transporter small permease subunit [Dongia deserti]|uniref:TRAP transporter small permease subunit n=1 Tax=Dongia deserti TaxID=2268030 RepID=UPI000E646A9C|nr:TRAP transporter small permease subunit [Dongia deserti]